MWLYITVCAMHSHEVLKSLHFNTFMQLSLIYIDFESINFLIIIFLTRFAIVVLYSLIGFLSLHDSTQSLL